jgi:hypothetical protein
VPRILKSQANAVLSSIQKSDMDPNDFSWTVRESWVRPPPDDSVSCLVHKGTDHYFLFDLTAEGIHYALYEPGEEKERDQHHAGDWQTQLRYVRQWLTYLKREIEAPDLWATIGSQSKTLSGIWPNDKNSNDPFSIEEGRQVKSSLDEIQAYMEATYQLTSTQSMELAQRLSYLGEAAYRMGRKDWLNLALGVLINVAVASAFAPEAAKGLIQFASGVFHWLVGGAVLPP